MMKPQKRNKYRNKGIIFSVAVGTFIIIYALLNMYKGVGIISFNTPAVFLVSIGVFIYLYFHYMLMIIVGLICYIIAGLIYNNIL